MKLILIKLCLQIYTIAYKNVDNLLKMMSVYPKLLSSPKYDV